MWAAVAQTLFICLYAFRPWWRAFVGRALFTKSLALAVLFDVAILNRYLDYPHEDVVFEWSFFVVVVGITLQLAALVREIRRDR